MHVAPFVISQRVLLQSFLHHLVGYDNLLRTFRLNHQLQNVKKLACIATAVTHHGIGLAQLNVALAQFGIGCYGAVEQLHKVFFFKRFEHI